MAISDSDPGIGVGTPISGGAPAAPTTFAEPLKYTLLSLPYYAKIMGINPVHFQGAYGQSIWPVGSGCDDIWPRYTWQNHDRLSHDELVRAIYQAEQQIARELGYFPAPYWIAQEVHRFPRHYRRDIWKRNARNLRGAYSSILADYGKIIQSGQRAVTLVGTATTGLGSLVFSDVDGDGFSETATVQVATTLTDECELKVYFTGRSGAQEWEIRPARTKTISGGFFTAVFDSWLFIDPDLQAAHPTLDGYSGIDVSTTTNYVTAVDVYREYNDFTVAGCTFYWEPLARSVIGSFCTSCSGTGCPACSLTSQDGCLHPRDTEKGIVVPQPATYNASTGVWDSAAFTECRDPDQVKINYYSGLISDEWRRGTSCEMLSNYWAQAIAWLATARLTRPACACPQVKSRFEWLMEDLSYASREGGTYSLDFEDALKNPFGTHRGEIMAWRQINSWGRRRVGGGAV